MRAVPHPMSEHGVLNTHAYDILCTVCIVYGNDVISHDLYIRDLYAHINKDAYIIHHKVTYVMLALLLHACVDVYFRIIV